MCSQQRTEMLRSPISRGSVIIPAISLTPVIPKTTKNKLNGSDLVDALSRMAQIEATSLLRRITTTELGSVRELGWRTLTSLAGCLARVEWKCYGPDTDVWPSAQFCRVPVAWLRLGCRSRWDVNIRAKPPRFFPLLFHLFPGGFSVWLRTSGLAAVFCSCCFKCWWPLIHHAIVLLCSKRL